MLTFPTAADKPTSSVVRVTAVAVTVLVLAVVSCSPGPSVEAFCDTLAIETSRLEAKYEERFGSLDVEADPFGALFGTLGSAIEGMGDAVVLFDRLERVAPEEIQPDVAAVRDGLEAQVDALRGSSTDPLALFGASIVGSLSIQGSATAVESYIAAHC